MSDQMRRVSNVSDVYEDLREAAPSECDPVGSAEDTVNNPAHYVSGKVECIEAIEAAVDNPVDYYRGTCLKYIWRSGRKVDSVEDLKKAVWYLNRWVDFLEGDK